MDHLIPNQAIFGVSAIDLKQRKVLRHGVSDKLPRIFQTDLLAESESRLD
jgi:hypothetical protein